LSISRIDLHLHTLFSDGTLSPQETVRAAAALGVTLLAITDHDEVCGVPLAQAVGDAVGVRVISGVEINTEVGKEDVHILGYGFAPDAPVLLQGLLTQREARLQRLLLMLERLRALNYPLDTARVLAIAGSGSVGRPHVARALIEAGYVATNAEAFARFIGNRCPAYVPRTTLTPEAAIALIHRAGGLASLAHPGKLGDPIRILRRLQGAGLDALEAYHSDHTPAVTERLLRWAKQFNLAVTGGTDSHGPHGPRLVEIGSVPVPDWVGAQLLELLAK
jgi:predicted metal-dependent phosphoesterase TrpH